MADGLKLIKNIVLVSDGNPVVFSNLDGNNEGIYLLEIDAVKMTDVTKVSVRPNGQTSNLRSVGLIAVGPSMVPYDAPDPVIFYEIEASENRFLSSVQIAAKSGKPRVAKFDTSIFEQTGSHPVLEAGAISWNDDSANITSIVVDTDGSGMKAGSRFTLYEFKK